MDHACIDKIEQLLVAAAGIMEDASAGILFSGDGTLGARIERVRAAADALTSFAEAAADLLE